MSIGRPKLALVIAEDDFAVAHRVKKHIDEKFEEWPFRQIDYLTDFRIEIKDNMVDFAQCVDAYLEKKYLVFATSDLRIRPKPGEDPEDRVSHEIVTFCLEKLQRATTSKDFDFCIMSASRDLYQALLEDKETGEGLSRLGVNYIDKQPITNMNNPYMGLPGEIDKVLDELKKLVLRNLEFGFYHPEELQYGNVVPFTDDLLRYAYLVNKIIDQNMTGFFLIFTEDTGYEESWFHFLCELKKIKPTFVDLSLPKWPFTPEVWTDCILIQNISETHSGSDAYRMLTQESETFIQQIKSSGKLVFMQFPMVQSINVTTMMKGKEELLNTFLKEVYGEEEYRNMKPGIDFAYQEHDRIIIFPDIGQLQRQGVVNKTIESLQSLLNAEGESRTIDEELFEVLSSLPGSGASFNKKDQEELPGLQKMLLELYKKSDRKLSKISIHACPENHDLRKIYNSDWGLLVRGRFIYQDLKRNSGRMDLEDDRAFNRKDRDDYLNGLKIIQQLYRRLKELLYSYNQRENLDSNLFVNKDFTKAHFEVLDAAHHFLYELLGDYNTFYRSVKRFESKIRKPNWENYYPLSFDQNSLKDFAETIELKWPIDKLPLHFEIYKYFLRCGVRPEIGVLNKASLARFPDLLKTYNELKTRKNQLLKQFRGYRADLDQINERLSEDVHNPAIAQLNLDSPFNYQTFKDILSSFLTFHAHLAIIENKSRTIHDLNEKLTITDCWNIISNHLTNLSQTNQLNKSDIFNKWEESWAPDWIISIFEEVKNTVPGDAKGSDSRLPEEQGNCSIISIVNVVELFLIMNDMTNQDDYWSKNGAHAFDLLKCFIIQVSPSDIRLEFKQNNINNTWEKSQKPIDQKPNDNEVIDSINLFRGNRLLFSVDHFLRIRPGSQSVWILSDARNGRWSMVLNGHPKEHKTLTNQKRYKWLPNLCNINHDVFVSYRGEDKNEVFELVNTLKSHKVRIWTDQDISKGPDWRPKLVIGMKATKIALIMIGTQGMSDEQNTEIGFLWEPDGSRQIIPILLHGVDKFIKKTQKISSYIEDNNWLMLDATDNPIKSIKKAIIEADQRLIKTDQDLSDDKGEL